jgi:hypothetical protein
MRVQPEKSEISRFKTIEQFCTDNPAFTIGGVRHAIFFLGPKIEEAGALVRFGRKRLINTM